MAADLTSDTTMKSWVIAESRTFSEDVLLVEKSDLAALARPSNLTFLPGGSTFLRRRTLLGATCEKSTTIVWLGIFPSDVHRNLGDCGNFRYE